MAEGSPTQGGDSAPSQEAATVAAGEREALRRLHILPIGQDAAGTQASERLKAVAPELRRKRSAREIIRAGDLLREGGKDFVVIKCDPQEGILDGDTDYYFDGDQVIHFDKIQFSAWGADEMTSEQLFKDFMVPFFKGDYSPYGSPNSKRVRLFYLNQMFKIGDVHFQVEATEPGGLGVVTNQTEIFAKWDQTPEFEKVHIVPFQDTLPRAYEYDIFQDYLKPYLQVNPHKKFAANELFMYHGVQFKLVAAEPNVTARIGRGTAIYCEGVLHPSLRNLLPPDLLSQVAQLPVGLQMLLLSTERTTRELEDMLTQRRGLFEETLSQIERFTWPPSDTSQDASSQSTCMICLGDFAIGDSCRRLPCRHVFHSDCVDEWLRRCTDCPICKDNVDRAIRQY